MRENKNGVPGTSEYFRLAVIHGGMPDGSTRDRYPEFCVHRREAFPNWHRPYLLDFERSMRRADIAEGGDGNIGLPYWDWSQPVVRGQVFPGFVRQSLLEEFPPDFFPPNVGSTASLTLRTPSDNNLANQLRGSDIIQLAGQCLHSVRNSQFSCTLFQTADSPSVESPHNRVHVMIGGVMASMQSSFHPIFWMHHCNIDRIWDRYLELEPDSAEEFRAFQATRPPQPQEGFPDGPWGRLRPFVNHLTGQTFHTRDTFDSGRLGYRFDRLPEVPALQMREPPHFAMFRGVDIRKMGQSRRLFVFVVDKALGWVPPSDRSPEALMAHPNYAGSDSIFFSGSQICRNCRAAEPINLFVDITSALRNLRIPPSRCELKVLVENVEDGNVVDIHNTPVPFPELKGPMFNSLEGGTGNMAALQEHLSKWSEDVHTTKHGGLQVKPGDQVTWNLKMDTLPAGLKASDVIADLERAFQVWSEPTGIRFQRTEGAGRISISWSAGPLDIDAKFDGPGGKLAHATASGVTFDGTERWEVAGKPHKHRKFFKPEASFLNPFFKLLPVAIHEIGHVLGMGHSHNPADVMGPYYREDRIALSAADKRRVQQLIGGGGLVAPSSVGYVNVAQTIPPAVISTAPSSVGYVSVAQTIPPAMIRAVQPASTIAAAPVAYAAPTTTSVSAPSATYAAPAASITSAAPTTYTAAASPVSSVVAVAPITSTLAAAPAAHTVAAAPVTYAAPVTTASAAPAVTYAAPAASVTSKVAGSTAAFSVSAAPTTYTAAAAPVSSAVAAAPTTSTLAAAPAAYTASTSPSTYAAPVTNASAAPGVTYVAPAASVTSAVAGSTAAFSVSAAPTTYTAAAAPVSSVVVAAPTTSTLAAAPAAYTIAPAPVTTYAAPATTTIAAPAVTSAVPGSSTSFSVNVAPSISRMASAQAPVATYLS